MAVKVAINGFGRMGRLVLRAMIESGRTAVECIAINDLADVAEILNLTEEERAAIAAHRISLVAEGWTEAWRAPRLVRGAPLEWHPDHSWGQFNHALG